MRRLNPDAVKESLPDWLQRTTEGNQQIHLMQTAVFVMCGGGLLGSFAASQPADFYIDDRVGRLPYSRREITQAVKILEMAAVAAGLDPRHLPEHPSFHNMGVF